MGYIKGSKYIKSKPKNDPIMESSTFKSWEHDVGRSNHRRDMIQPYDPDGTFNQEFIYQYLLKDQELADQYGFNPRSEDEQANR